MIKRSIAALILVGVVNICLAHDVIVNRNSNLRTEPNSNSDIIKTLKPDEEARLLELHEFGGYYRVLHKDGIGYLWGNNVTIYPEYMRKHWRHWIDEDRDCQDARQEALIVESKVPVTFKTDDDCKVKEGLWSDPFTGLDFTNPGDLDVDHMVPLQNAHRSGGWNWSYDKRKDYANDLAHPEHLIAVSASANRSKGAKGPDKWLPPNEGHLCQYVHDWEAIKIRWELEISDSEASAIAEVKNEHC